MISFAAVYYLAPKLWNRQRLYSIRMVNWHFWLATLGIVLYAAAMWVAGIQQGLMWREYDDQGFLVYSFAETVLAMFPYYVIRTLGGVLYLAGGFVMAGRLSDHSRQSAQRSPDGRCAACNRRHHAACRIRSV
jgi:cytochrome c oxidase cbb3-type subunit 1